VALLFTLAPVEARRDELLKHALKALGDINNPKATRSAKKIAKLKGDNVEYYHSIQKFNDKKVDETARNVITNAKRRAHVANLKSNKRFEKLVSLAKVSRSAADKIQNAGKPKKVHPEDVIKMDPVNKNAIQ